VAASTLVAVQPDDPLRVAEVVLQHVGVLSVAANQG